MASMRETHQTSHGFMSGVWHLDGVKLTGTVLTRQLDRVTVVRFERTGTVAAA
jgi:hypothetical protein